MKNTTLNFNTIAEVRSTLMAYPKCYVYSDGENERVSTGVYISATGNDKLIKTFEAKEVLTTNEFILGYINNFRSFPASYKGKYDWPLMQKLIKGEIQQLGLDENGSIVEI